MSATRKDATAIVVGGEPRIDFLPPEVKAGKQARKTRRSLLGLVIIVVAACVAGYVFATTLAVQSQLALVDAQAETQRLISEQAQFAEARTVTNQAAAIKDARLVGMSNEVLWTEFLGQLAASVPSGTSITSVSVDSLAAFEARPVTAIPLQQPRVATLTVRALAPDLPSISTWIENLRKLPGFADAWATPAQLEDAGYSVEITLNINADVFEKRFFADYDAAAGDAVAPADDENAEDEGADDAPTVDDPVSTAEPEVPADGSGEGED